MQRGNHFLSICAGIFGAVLLVQLVRHDAGSRIEARLRGQQQRVLYNNYLWQRDDDDDYFSNTNNTGYFSYNQNYKAQGNGNYLGGGSYVNGYNGSSYSNNDDGNDDDGQISQNDDSIKKSSSASSGAFGGLSPAKSAFLGIFIGLLLISVIACCLYGPTMWALFTDWLFNRKNTRVEHDFDNLA
ncbi:unnamed protein product [Cylindrotheca closterium]|uniref:Uncharacterized protein n=1 Tax=Cylindrotheca closterium TaxID=2856 RepID=A0AAD2GD58_9STRA|nr:unnamed protein product [Cylindrotheca closterium]